MSAVASGAPHATSRAGVERSRVVWVDLAKGWCIVLVVTMHSTLGVGEALDGAGWLHALVAFAKPFRMPDFFLIAGLFVARAIDLPWRAYLDRKLVHFLYFYALWLAIVLTVKSVELGIAAPGPFIRTYLWSFIEPFSTMWFIHLLPILFVVVRLLRHVPVPLVIAAAIALHLAAAAYPGGDLYTMSSALTGWNAPDNFALFFIYFYLGASGRSLVFQFARVTAQHPLTTLAGLFIWGVVEALAVRSAVTEIPGLTLIFGLAGALAVVAGSSLLAKSGLFAWLAGCGRHSLVIYLSFVIPMAAARIALLRTGTIDDIGWLSLIVAVFAIATPLALYSMTSNSWLSFLFIRPAWARLRMRGPT